MAPSKAPNASLPPQQSGVNAQPGQPARPKAHPKRKGPQPARHIPWPEIFKHHISLVEGHLKMIEMVQKHTVEGSGNHRTISDLVKRSKDMLYQAKNVARIFVPPPNQLESVPLGSSSDTMYPGYSPANHEYGKAAEEFGKYASEAKKKGVEIKPEGIDYVVGQSKGLAHMTLAQIRAAKGDAGSGSDAGAPPAAPSSTNATERKEDEAKPAAADDTPAEPMFFMDPNPTPINLSTTANSSAKRKATPEPVEANTAKKQKKTRQQQGDSKPQNYHGKEPPEPVKVEFEDISGEVDARLREKEERRKRKEGKREEKKRKRDSEGCDPAGVAPTADTATDVTKPKKKKSKKATENGKASGTPKRKSAMDDEEAVEGSSVAVAAEKPKKKVKASHDGLSKEKTKKRDSAEDEQADEAAGKKKKKRARTEA